MSRKSGHRFSERTCANVGLAPHSGSRRAMMREAGMFGWRKRIGYIAPTVIEVVAYEFYRFAPDGHRPHRRHLQHRRLAARGVREGPRPGRRSRDLSRLARRRFHHSRRRAAGGRARAALRGDHRPRRRGRRQGQGDHVDPRRHGGAAPHQGAPDRDRLALPRAAQRSTDRPFEATASRWSARTAWICRSRRCRTCRPPTFAAFAGVLAAAPDCDALYLPCPQWQAAQIVEELEQATGKLVVAYTHACFFVAFRAMG